MKPSELEAKARNIARRVLADQPVEDTIYELKSAWPEPPSDAAKQLAGAANAARGEPLLWIIGVHEKQKKITGATNTEVSSWYDQIVAECDERVAPRMLLNKNVSYEKDDGTVETIVALLFDTTEAPYVINNPRRAQKDSDDRGIAREVPWRQGNSIRTARRQDLQDMLVSVTTTPNYEVMDGSFENFAISTVGRRYVLRLMLTAYVMPKTNQTLTIPFHMFEGTTRFAIDSADPMSLDLVRIAQRQAVPFFASSATVLESRDEVIISGPGKIEVWADVRETDCGKYNWNTFDCDVEFAISLGIVHAARPIVLRGTMVPGRMQNTMPPSRSWNLSKSKA